jgi:Arc/MetJ family transcription regulator
LSKRFFEVGNNILTLSENCQGRLIDDGETIMRTNVVLNDDLIREAMQYTTVRTKRALIEQALRTFVEVKAADQRRRTYAERVGGLQDRLAGVTLRTSAVDILREDRQRR